VPIPKGDRRTQMCRQLARQAMVDPNHKRHAEMVEWRSPDLHSNFVDAAQDCAGSTAPFEVN